MSEAVEQVNREKQGNGELPEGWIRATIDEVTDQIEKVKPEEKPNSRFTYLDISSIDNEIQRIVDPKFYYGKDAPSRARQLVESNDVLFSTVRTYLKNIALVPDAYDGEIASTGFSVLRSKSAVLPKYLFYFSITDDFISELSNLQRGTSYPAVRDDDVRSRVIPLAPLPEQKRIVEIIETQFTRLDAAVKSLERAQIKLERYRASVLQAACEGRLVPTEAELAQKEGHDYEPGEQLLERILAERRRKWEEERWAYEIERAKKKAAQAERKAAGLPYYIRELEPEHWQDRAPQEYEPYLPKSDKWKEKYDEPEPPDTEDLPELPEGWCWASIDEITTPVKNVRPDEKPDTRFTYLDISSINNKLNIITEPKFYDGKNAPSRARQLVKENDVLFSTVRTYLKNIALVPAAYDGEIASTGFSVLRSLSGISPKYLFYYSITDNFISEVSNLQRGTSYPAVRDDDVRSRFIPIPPLPEQNRIVSEVERRLSIVDALEETVSANLTRAERMRQAILKKAFEGRLVEQRPEEEPASVLLERLKAGAG